MLAHPATKLHGDNTQQDPNLNIQHPENLQSHYHKSMSHYPTYHFII
jgi:hypothetical protein